MASADLFQVPKLIEEGFIGTNGFRRGGFGVSQGRASGNEEIS